MDYLEIEKLKTETLLLSGISVRFNPNHDSKGRFTTGNGGGGVTGGSGSINNITGDGKTYNRALNEAKNEQNERVAWRVDTDSHGPDDFNDCKALIKTDGGSVAAVTKDGDIISVCANPNDTVKGSELIAAAVEAGGTKLDSYDGNYGFYRKCGFEPVSWTKWDDRYAPSGWDPKQDFREDIIFFKYTGNKSNLSRAQLELEKQNWKAQKTPAADYDAAEKERG